MISLKYSSQIEEEWNIHSLNKKVLSKIFNKLSHNNQTVF